MIGRRQFRGDYRGRNSLFFPPKNKRLANAISIRTPVAFKKSISRVRKMKGIPRVTKSRALVLARNRAIAQLHRRNLSQKERVQMAKIAGTKIKV